MGSTRDYGRSHIRALARAFMKTEDILKLSAQGMDVKDIAVALRLRPNTVHRVIRDNAGPSPTVIGSLPWSRDQDETILRMRQREARIWSAVAEVVGRSPAEVTARHAYLMQQMQKRATQAETKVGTCMACKGPFLAQGRWNRLCAACKSGHSSLPDHFAVITDSLPWGRSATHY